MLLRSLQARVDKTRERMAEELLNFVLSQSARFVLNHTTVSVQIEQTDPSYTYISDWMVNKRKQQPTHIEGVGQLTFPTAIQQFTDTDEPAATIAKRSTKINGTPAAGVYLIWYDGVPIVLQYVSEFQRDERRHTILSQRSLRLWSYRGQLETIIQFLREVNTSVAEDESRTVSIFTSTSSGYWERIHSARRRPVESVILPAQQKESLLSDIENFFDDEDWYYNNAVPFRRGYLLHGLPGTGKSSMVLSLAGEFNFRLYILNLADPELDDSRLQELTASTGDNAAILLEDVDSLWINRERQGKLSFSAVLNAIDGVTASQNRILFLTTNKLELLDPALIRPGRIDYRLEFGYLVPEQAATMIERFYPELGADVYTLADHPKIPCMVASELQKLLIDVRANPIELYNQLDAYSPVEVE